MFDFENNTSSWTESFSITSDLIFDTNLSKIANFTGEIENNGTKLNVPYAVVEALVAFLAVIGNAIVITVFYRERKLRKRTNYYIMSLATADFLVGFLGIPFAILVRKRHFSL
jgi:7 transmembrane receptor (rhodopsin family)